MTGLLHTGGEINFTVSILPENNGVYLRRALSNAYSPQYAKVYIDGVFAGDFYDAEHNEYLSFGDSDIMLPKMLTAGKDSINIKLCAETKFTDFFYEVYSIK